MVRRFRTGTKVGRTINRQKTDNPADGEQLIGMMDTSPTPTQPRSDAH